MAMCPNWSNPESVSIVNKLMEELNQSPLTDNEIHLFTTDKERLRVVTDSNRLKAIFASIKMYHDSEGEATTFSKSPSISERRNKSSLLYPVVGKSLYAINSRIRAIRDALVGNMEPVTKRLLQQRINELQADKLRLIDDKLGNSAEALKDVATRQLEHAREVLLKDTFNTEELKTAIDLVNTWKFERTQEWLSDNQLENADGDFYKALEEIGVIAENVAVIAKTTLLNYIETTVNNRLGEHRKDTDLKVIPEMGTFRGKLLSADMSNSDLIIVLDSILKDAKNNQIGLREFYFDKIEAMFKVFKDNKELAKSLGHNYDLFRQRDVMGEYTGNLVSLFSNLWEGQDRAFKIRLNDLTKKLEAGTISKKVYNQAVKNAYTEERRKSILLDLRFLSPGSAYSGRSSGQKFDNAQAYKDYLVKEYGTVQAEEFIAEAQGLNTKFINAKAAEKADIDNDDSITDKEAALDAWDMVNNPTRILAYVNGNPENEPLATRNHEYLLKAPRMYEFGSKKLTGFFDPNFKQIYDDPTLRTFYDQYTTLMRDLVLMLPENIGNHLPMNFLARVHKDLLEQIADKDFKGSFDSVMESVFNFYSKDEYASLNNMEELTFGRIEPLTKEIDKTVPLRHLQKYNESQHSTDLEKMIRMFAITAINYNYMNTVRNQAELMYSFINQTEGVNTDKRTGKTIIEDRRKISTSPSQAPIQKSLARYTMDAMLYDERTDKGKPSDKPTFFVTGKEAAEAITFGAYTAPSLVDDLARKIEAIKEETTGKPFKFKDKIKRYEMAKELELLRDELEEQLERDLDDSDQTSHAGIQALHNAKMKTLETKYRELGGRNLIYQNIGEFLMKVTQLKGLGLNATAGIANLLFGIVADINHANGRVEYDNKHFFKAFGLILKSLSQDPSNNKIFNIMKRLDILFETIDTRVDKNYKGNKYRGLKAFDPYVIQNKTEYINQSISVIASMLKKKIKLADGREISLFDAMGNDGRIKTELLDEQGKANWTNIIRADESNEYSKFRNSMIQLNKYLHGNYDPSSPIEIKKYLLGRMAMMFRSWIPMGFASRFLEKRYDPQLGRDIKGRWRTYGELGLRRSVSTLAKQLVLSDNAFSALQGEDLEVDTENMRRNLSELGLTLALSALMTMLKWSIDDDDEEKGINDYMAQVLINQTYRAYQDVFFYVNPITFYQIIKDPIPITKTVSDALRAIDGTYRYYFKPDYRGQPPSVKWAKVFPFTNQIPKVVFLATNDITD